jgi:phthalate 4,5-dioxygenase oxygenase subunit
MALTAEQQQTLVSTNAGTPMGTLFRRYWIPALLAEELPEPDCPPVRVRLLGEDLIAFRDTDGRLGLIEGFCPHRGVSLFFGRNEECGLRCSYHGWKFDVEGRCMEMPTEPEGYNFRDRMRARSYPVREAGGLIWTYLGPPESEPAFPEYDWTKLPKDQVAIIKVGERVNYLQAVEGSIDSSHSWFLHRDTIWDWKKRSEISSDLSPRLEAQDEPYGFRYAAIRKPNANPDTEKYVRVVHRADPAPARPQGAGARADLRSGRRRPHDVLRSVLQPGRCAGR